MKSTETNPRLESQEPHETVIEPTRGWSSLGLREVWAYRDLLYFLIVRDIQATYRQTALGTSWLLLRPIISVVLLTVVFGGFLDVSSEGMPYPLFAMAALIPWGYFSDAVLRATGSLVNNMHVISKVYFPRLIVPLAAVLAGLVDSSFSLLVFFGLLFIYRMPLRWEMLWLPVLMLVTIACALAAGLWLATLSVKYRDIQFGISYILQAMMLLSPVAYSVSVIPEQLRFLYSLNPMTGVIQGFRWALLGSEEAPGSIFFIAVVIIIIGLSSGAYVFRRTERSIVDVL